jgi:hypothetical protein
MVPNAQHPTNISHPCGQIRVITINVTTELTRHHTLLQFYNILDGYTALQFL